MNAVTKIVIVVFALIAGNSAWAQSLVERKQMSPNEVFVAIQKLCPVSGQQLGQHGPPIKATVGKQEEQVFLCCKSCLGKQIDPKVWERIHRQYMVAQGRCPVMKNPLPKKLTMTIADGRPIYTCCPPCVKKIAREPDKYVREVDRLYAISLNSN